MMRAATRALAGFLAALVAACAAEPPPPVPGPLTHQHRVLADGKHFVIITAEAGPEETDQMVVDRIRFASADLAGIHCPTGFDMLVAPDFEGHWLERLKRRTESYVFACR